MNTDLRRWEGKGEGSNTTESTEGSEGKLGVGLWSGEQMGRKGRRI
jgi:hypothetical protein